MYDRVSIAGISVSDNVMNAINSSEHLLYVVGKEADVGEKHYVD